MIRATCRQRKHSVPDRLNEGRDDWEDGKESRDGHKRVNKPESTL